MKSRHEHEGKQMRLTLPAPSPVTISKEVEAQLIAALADLLLVVARRSDVTNGGGRDEREDQR